MTKQVEAGRHRLEPEEEQQLLRALRAGDEAAFAGLVARYHAMLVRLAALYVPDQAAAEEVAQETWLAVLNGLPRFEGRASLKTWICRILTNRAKTRGQREARSVPFSALEPELAGDEPAVPPDYFEPPGDPWAGHWREFPADWEQLPEARLLSDELKSFLLRAIAALPPGQRQVITLRDVEGWPSDEVCNLLGLSETNQRVLLHRARSRVRQALARYLEETSNA